MLKWITKIAIKSQSKKKLFKRYLILNDDIMAIVSDIEKLRLNIDDPKVAKKINLLEKSKKTLEKELIVIEENFYDVSRGLWVGTAYDLEDVDAEPFLLYIPFSKIHNHMEVFGTSGYGKSRLLALIVRQIMHFGWSAFVVDPKGGEEQEVAAWLYEFAAETGMQKNVMRIMPSYPNLSDKANPIFAMDDIEIASMCSTLAISSSSGVQSSSEAFYSGQVYRTIYAILTSMTYLENAISPDGKDVARKVVKEVQKYIDFKKYNGKDGFYEDETYSIPDIAEKINSGKDKNKEILHKISPYNRTLVTFRELSYYVIYENIIELENIVVNTPVPILQDKKREEEIKNMKELALRSLKEITTLEKKFYQEVGSSLSILLSQLAYGPVGEVLCDIKINPLIKKVRDKEGVIIIFQPAPMRFKKVSEILIKIYTEMWLSLFGTIGASGRGIHKRVAYCIDEAKPMMFPGVEELYNKVRQLGMTLIALYQSKSDLKYKLGETLADIVQDNTATSITMKQVSMSSRTEMAASFGTIKRAENVQMTEMDGGGRSTVIYSDVELVSADDINSLGIGEGFLQHDGRKYYVKFPYQKDPPPVNITMPKLESERSYEFIAQAEKILTNESKKLSELNELNRS